MKKLLLALVLLYACGVHAQNYDVGNIAVVHGGPNIAGGLIGAAEMAAGVEFYKTHGDLFDFMVVYTTFTPSMNMQQGLPIAYTVTGINREGSFTGYGPASKWGSAGRLIGGTRMCHIDQYPDDPDTNMPFPLGGMTSVELLAHEFSHYWLAAMDFKKEGETENNTGLRGYESESANQHWNHYYSSGPSVEYGSHIVDNGDGSFTFNPATPRKYSEFDQYILGLRAPEEVAPLFFLCNYDDITTCSKEGSPSMPTPHTGSSDTISNMYKHEVTIEDVIRAMGPRVPAAADAPKHWNVAFVIINQPGIDPFPLQLEKLDTLRVRFQEWFEWATDGRGTICTELDGDCGNVEPTDDDVVVPDDTVTDDQPTDNELPDDTVVDDTVTDDQPTNDDTVTDTAVADDTQPTDNGETPDTNTSGPDEVLVEEEPACGCTLVF